MIIRRVEETEAEVFDGGEYRGCEMRRMIAQEDGAPGFALRVFTLAPEGYTPYHSHPHEHEVFILAGSGSLRTQEGEHRLQPGDAILLAPFDHHQLRAGAEGLQFICCAPHH